MDIHPIRLFGDPVLRTASTPVLDFSNSLQLLVQNLQEVLKQSKGVGLAAPQIGVPLRVFVWSFKNNSGVLVNPILTQKFPDDTYDEEGCLSIPGLFFATPRANQVKISGYDTEHKPLTILAEGMLARIFQHEVDHLDGKFFVDNLIGEDRKNAFSQIRQALPRLENNTSFNGGTRR